MFQARSRVTPPKVSPPLDRKMFIATPRQSRESLLTSTPRTVDQSFDELTSSPLHVEPYPQRRVAANETLPDTPSQRRLEGVYDRFLMATSGVKRLGKGYQSDSLFNSTPNVPRQKPISRQKSTPKFASIRRAQPPMPLPSNALNKDRMTIDELGVMNFDSTPTTTTHKDESNATIARMRRAMKAIVPGRAVVSRRASRVQ